MKLLWFVSSTFALASEFLAAWIFWVLSKGYTIVPDSMNIIELLLAGFIFTLGIVSFVASVINLFRK